MVKELFHVLVADDEELHRYILKKLLDNLGYCVTEAVDGLEALAFLSTDRTIDLVVTDMQMPQMTGMQLITAIRLNTQFSLLPILVVATVDQAAADFLVDDGANAVCCKPVEQETFIEKVQSLLQQKVAAPTLAVAL